MAKFNGATDKLDHLQAGTAERLAGFRDKIIVNDFNAVLARVKSFSGSETVDIVLDNSGFELFTDLVLAHWLVARGKAKKVRAL